MNEIIVTENNTETNNENNKLQSLGFENEHEYKLYLQMKKSLQQPVPIGIAS